MKFLELQRSALQARTDITSGHATSGSSVGFAEASTQATTAATTTATRGLLPPGGEHGAGRVSRFNLLLFLAPLPRLGRLIGRRSVRNSDPAPDECFNEAELAQMVQADEQLGQRPEGLTSEVEDLHGVVDDEDVAGEQPQEFVEDERQELEERLFHVDVDERREGVLHFRSICRRRKSGYDLLQFR